MSDIARKSADRALGMESAITRRDFLGATLLASGAQLLNSRSPAQLFAQQPNAALPGAGEDWNGFGAGKPAPREVLRSSPFGHIAFANTDLAGAMDHRCSILEARRAVSQLFDSVIA